MAHPRKKNMGPAVKKGQVYRDLDPRSPGRTLTVVELKRGDLKAKCESVSQKGKRTVYVAIARLRTPTMFMLIGTDGSAVERREPLGYVGDATPAEAMPATVLDAPVAATIRDGKIVEASYVAEAPLTSQVDVEA